MNQELYNQFRETFPQTDVEILPGGVIHICDPPTEVMLHWLLDRQVTKVGLDQPCHGDIMTLLFSFDEVWHSADWEPFFRTWLLTQHQSQMTYLTKIIKINNLRWLFSKKDLTILLKVFPFLVRAQFVGAEFGEKDDLRVEKDCYPDAPPQLSTKKVQRVLGSKADPFSL
jgi:hypothetical protein